MSTKYTYNPIVEAVCEFQFEQQVDWDLTIPGLVFEHLKGAFPTRRQARTVELSISGEQHARVSQSDRVQFVRADEAALVQVGPHLLAVNRLKPYESWEEFLPLILSGLAAYTTVAGPQTFRRLGLRYINHIRIPQERVELEDYFEFRPVQGPRLPDDFSAFTAGMVFPFSHDRDQLHVQLGNLVWEGPAAVPIVLDFDYFLAKPGTIPPDGVADWIQTAHQRIEDAFEACIKDSLRQLFHEGVL